MSANKPEPPAKLVPMDTWQDNKTGENHAAFRENESGDVLTTSHRLNEGWYGPVKHFLEQFKKIRDKLHLF